MCNIVCISPAEVDPNAWESRKRALEKDIERENLHISEYYLRNIKKALLRKEYYTIKQKIVDRKFYQDEFKKIWNEQCKYYQKEFSDKNKIAEIADCFYIHNREKNKEIRNKDLFHLFFNDIIYIKSQLCIQSMCVF